MLHRRIFYTRGLRDPANKRDHRSPLLSFMAFSLSRLLLGAEKVAVLLYEGGLTSFTCPSPSFTVILTICSLSSTLCFNLAAVKVPLQRQKLDKNKELVRNYG